MGSRGAVRAVRADMPVRGAIPEDRDTGTPARHSGGYIQVRPIRQQLASQLSHRDIRECSMHPRGSDLQAGRRCVLPARNRGGHYRRRESQPHRSMPCVPGSEDSTERSSRTAWRSCSCPGSPEIVMKGVALGTSSILSGPRQQAGRPRGQSSSARCGWPAEEFLAGWAVD